jgi:hypothetical protein
MDAASFVRDRPAPCLQTLRLHIQLRRRCCLVARAAVWSCDHRRFRADGPLRACPPTQEKFLLDRIKVGGKVGNLGDLVTVSRDKAKVHAAPPRTQRTPPAAVGTAAAPRQRQRGWVRGGHAAAGADGRSGGSQRRCQHQRILPASCAAAVASAAAAAAALRVGDAAVAVARVWRARRTRASFRLHPPSWRLPPCGESPKAERSPPSVRAVRVPPAAPPLRSSSTRTRPSPSATSSTSRRSARRLPPPPSPRYRLPLAVARR